MKLINGITLGQLPAAVLMLVVLGVVLSVGIKMNDQFAGSTTTDWKYMAAQNSTNALLNIAQNQPLLGLIIVMGAIITILLLSFRGVLGGGGGL